MTEERNFDPRVIGSITSGVLLIDGFSKVHEAIEFMTGHPVWTHELPSASRALIPSILARYADMPVGELPDWQATATALVEKYGDAISVSAGNGTRERSPLDTLAEMVAPKDIIVVTKQENG
jgi:hypothetical protein